MTDLFSALKVYGTCPVVCLSCVHFAGAAYDQGGFLLAKKSGYCSLRIKKGDWNVLQRIDSPRQCKNFDESPDEVKKQRLKALDYYGRKFRGDSLKGRCWSKTFLGRESSFHRTAGVIGRQKQL